MVQALIRSKRAQGNLFVVCEYDRADADVQLAGFAHAFFRLGFRDRANGGRAFGNHNDAANDHVLGDFEIHFFADVRSRGRKLTPKFQMNWRLIVQNNFLSRSGRTRGGSQASRTVIVRQLSFLWPRRRFWCRTTFEVADVTQRDKALLTRLRSNVEKIVRAIKDGHLLPALEGRTNLHRSHCTIEVGIAFLPSALNLTKLLRLTNERQEKANNKREGFGAAFHASPAYESCATPLSQRKESLRAMARW